MTEKIHSQLALNAMRRAYIQALQKAANNGLKLPVWQNGKIVFVDAKGKVASSDFVR